LSRDTKLPHEGGTHATFVDGHTQLVSADDPIEERRKMITIPRDERTAVVTGSSAMR